MVEKRFIKYFTISNFWVAKFKLFSKKDNISGIFCSKSFDIIIIFLFFNESIYWNIGTNVLSSFFISLLGFS